MTPKEKAKELFKDYILLTADNLSDENFKRTKKCALICITEILKSLNNIEGQNESLYEEEEYYLEVKKEIEKL